MRVVNKRAYTPAPGEHWAYIGRPSPLGNPFSHKDGTLAQYKVATRAEAVAAYETWLRLRIEAGDPAVLQALSSLRACDVLVCWCKPAACHGDVLIKVLKELKEA